MRYRRCSMKERSAQLSSHGLKAYRLAFAARVQIYIMMPAAMPGALPHSAPMSHYFSRCFPAFEMPEFGLFAFERCDAAQALSILINSSADDTDSSILCRHNLYRHSIRAELQRVS